MKVLKITGIVLLILIAVPLLVALFLPKSYTVSVSETIGRPRQEVYDYMRILENQQHYSVWFQEDPDMVPVIQGTDGTVGAIQRWDSEKMGAGEQEIKVLTPDRMEVELRFIRPFEGVAHAAYLFEALSENETKVTSEFFSTSPYPMNLMSYLFGRKYVQDAQTQDLSNIKEQLEK